MLSVIGIAIAMGVRSSKQYQQKGAESITEDDLITNNKNSGSSTASPWFYNKCLYMITANTLSIVY